MQYIEMGGTLFSRISLGTASFGSAVDKETAFSIMDRYKDLGGNLLDTAAVYGMGLSEQTVGQWLHSRGLFGKVYISTKGCHPSVPEFVPRLNKEALRHDIERSLRLLGVECVDVYFLHRDDERLPVEDIMPMLYDLVKKGSVRMLGASNWTVKRIEEANAFARQNGMTPFSCSQILWNAANVNQANMPDKTLVAMDEKEHSGYRKNGMPIMAYTSQAQGLFSHMAQKGADGIPQAMKRLYMNDTTRRRAERILAVSKETGLSPTALSLAYLLEDEVKAIPIIGTSTPQRINENMQVFGLSEDILAQLFA